MIMEYDIVRLRAIPAAERMDDKWRRRIQNAYCERVKYEYFRAFNSQSVSKSHDYHMIF